jgi:hypothetical protein
MPRKSPVKADPQVIWNQLLPLISGGMSLGAAVAALPQPAPSLWWCKERIRDHPDLAAQYRQAQEERADMLADQIVAVAEEQMPSGLSGPEASAWAQRQRLRVDAMKWTAAKLRPRAWGEHVQVDLNVSQTISIREALAQAERRVHSFIGETAAVEDARVIAIGDKLPRQVEALNAVTCSKTELKGYSVVDPESIDAASVPG